MRSAIVIGGSGFIGSVLLRQLIGRGVTCRNLDKRPSAFHPDITQIVDVRNEGALSDAMSAADAIFLLAAEHADDVQPPSLYHDVNVGGARNVCRAADKVGVRKIIFTSSVAVYGLNAGKSDEDCPANPFNEYGRSKLAAEAVLKNWLGEDADRALTIVRLVVVFGERNRGNVYNLMDAVRRRRFLMVGKGQNRKSMAYVENVASFLDWAAERARGMSIFNYADKPDLTTGELVEIVSRSLERPSPKIRIPYAAGLAGGTLLDLVSRTTGKRFPISAIRIRKFCSNTVVKADKAHGAGFLPSIPLSEGLRRMIAHDFLGEGGDGVWFEGGDN
jgi:nucleoside-diphosphate-sugar epimerase